MAIQISCPTVSCIGLSISLSSIQVDIIVASLSVVVVTYLYSFLELYLEFNHAW